MPARGLDHTVLAVRSLDAAVDWERIGFTLTPRAQHPWGTANRLVQLHGSFLEILEVADADAISPHDGNRFSFGRFNEDYLAEGEGFSMLVLESNDAAADLDAYRAAGLPAFDRFDFERIAQQPDGRSLPVAFSLAITQAANAPRAGFFSCQQHYPQNFWKPDYQKHANGAKTLSAVVAVADEPAAHAEFLQHYSGSSDLVAGIDSITLRLPRGRIEVVSPRAYRLRFGALPAGEGLRLGALVIGVEDVAAAVAMAGRGGADVRERDGASVVDAASLHGVALAFEPLA